MRGSAGISPADAEREFGSSEGALDGGIHISVSSIQQLLVFQSHAKDGEPTCN